MIFRAGLVCSLSLFFVIPIALAQTAPEAASSPLPVGELYQCEFARLLVDMLELTDELPPAATPEDCAELLSRYGVEPIDGWNCDILLNESDLEVILVRALKIENEVRAGDYRGLLTAKGIPLPAPDVTVTFADISNIFNEETFAEMIAISYRTRTTPI